MSLRRRARGNKTSSSELRLLSAVARGPRRSPRVSAKCCGPSPGGGAGRTVAVKVSRMASPRAFGRKRWMVAVTSPRRGLESFPRWLRSRSRSARSLKSVAAVTVARRACSSVSGPGSEFSGPLSRVESCYSSVEDSGDEDPETSDGLSIIGRCCCSFESGLSEVLPGLVRSTTSASAFSSGSASTDGSSITGSLP